MRPGTTGEMNRHRIGLINLMLNHQIISGRATIGTGATGIGATIRIGATGIGSMTAVRGAMIMKTVASVIMIVMTAMIATYGWGAWPPG